MSDLPVIITILTLAVTAVITTLLYFHERNTGKKLSRDADKFLEQAQQKGWVTLHNSIKKSQHLLEEAELEGVKIAAGSKIATGRLEQDYTNALTQAFDHSYQSINAAQTQLLQFMEDLQKKSALSEETVRLASEQRVNQLFEKIENKLSDFLIQTEQKTTSSIELELHSARQLIETYKNGQLKLIDENIVAMMEQTLSTVLGKSMTLKGQLDLIYEALDKAKVEKFIV